MIEKAKFIRALFGCTYNGYEANLYETKSGMITIWCENKSDPKADEFGVQFDSLDDAEAYISAIPENSNKAMLAFLINRIS